MERAVREPKTERLEIRISRRLKNRIAEAARLRGTLLSEYVVSAVEETTSRVLEEQHTIRLSRKAAEDFVNLLLNPPPPNERLIRAAREYREWKGRRS